MAMSVDSLHNLYLNRNLDGWKSILSVENALTCRSNISCQSTYDKSSNQPNLGVIPVIVADRVDARLAQLQRITLQAERKDTGSCLLVNIIANDKIGKPSFSSDKRNSKSGFHWTIPHVICDHRHELNVKNSENVTESAQLESISQYASEDGLWVYDVIVNPVCIGISKENANLKNNLVRTAIRGIEKKFKLSLDIVDVKDLDCNNCISNSRNVGKESENIFGNNETLLSNCFRKEKFDDGKKMFDIVTKQTYNKEILNTEYSLDNTKLANGATDSFQYGSVHAADNDHEIIPEYKLKYVSHSSLQDYSIFEKYNVHRSKPENLALEIKLPGMSKASNINAKVVCKEFILQTINDRPYSLQVSLPYEVEEDPIKAQFDVVTGLLILEFTVKKQAIKSDISPTLSTDSGIECESEYRTSSDGDTTSISSQEECDNQTSTSDLGETKDKLRLGLCNDVQENTDKFILPSLTLSQNVNFLYLTIPCPNVVSSSIKLTTKNSDCFSFKYMTTGSGFAYISYGAVVYVHPYSIKQESLIWFTKEDNLLIQVEKKAAYIWKEIYVGLNLHNLSANIVAITNIIDTLVHTSSSANFGDSETKPSTDAITENGLETKKANLSTDAITVNCSETEKLNLSKDDNGSETEKVDLIHKASKSIEITRTRCTSDCFVTGSWPKGILKGRSRSLSDSQVDSSWVFGSFTELEDEVLEEDEDEILTQSENESPTTKKSVHFNDFISKQVFKSDASILGQRAKNRKKAQQKKRSRERKFSEGNSGSNQSQSEQSDANSTTTEDESNTEGEATDSQKINSKTVITNGKTKNKKGKSKKCRKVPYLSNNLIFQLDES